MSDITVFPEKVRCRPQAGARASSSGRRLGCCCARVLPWPRAAPVPREHAPLRFDVHTPSCTHTRAPQRTNARPDVLVHPRPGRRVHPRQGAHHVQARGEGQRGDLRHALGGQGAEEADQEHHADPRAEQGVPAHGRGEPAGHAQHGVAQAAERRLDPAQLAPALLPKRDLHLDRHHLGVGEPVQSAAAVHAQGPGGVRGEGLGQEPPARVRHCRRRVQVHDALLREPVVHRGRRVRGGQDGGHQGVFVVSGGDF
jgi:hypothetical protein